MSAGEPWSKRAAAFLDYLAWGWSDLRRIWAERGWWPVPGMVLARPGGDLVGLLGTRLRRMVGGGTKAQGQLVPRGDCLLGSLSLPDMPRKGLEQAVSEALWRVSPLPPDQILGAWQAVPQAQGGWLVQWGACRRDVQQAQREQLALPEHAPVFLEFAQGQALPARWPQSASVGRRAGAGVRGLLALLVLVALLSPLFLPLALKRQAVTRAMAHVTAAEAQAAPLRAQLDELRQQADLARHLQAAGQAQLPLASVVELLSAAVPDGAWLERIEINGSTLRIVGIADNAGELLALLARQPRLADVHATAASVRDNNLGKERFTAEMHWRDAAAQEGRP